MPHDFAGPAWVAAFQHAINQHPAYRESARTWEGDFLFVIEPDEPGVRDAAHIYLDLWHGECRAARLVSADEMQSEFVIRGPRRNWVKVLRRDTDPIRALMTGSLRLKGNLAKVLRNVRAAQDLVLAATTIDTAFPTD